MALSFKLAEAGDRDLLSNPAPGLFDKPIQPSLLTEFLADPRHHLIVAHDDAQVVGIVSAVDYVHPDKPRQLWINEVAVAPAFRGHGVASRMMRLMLDHGSRIGCTEGWVLTDEENVAANRLYRSAALEGSPDVKTQRMYSFDLN